MRMPYTMQEYDRSAQMIRERIGDFHPDLLVILGSGLGKLAEKVEDPVVVPYREIEGMPVSSAPGHAGRFVFGKFAGRNAAMMQGRIHTYEGCPANMVSYPVRLMKLVGASSLIVTNAAGAVNRDFRPGEIMLITDHIKMIGESPLTGENLDAFGPRFPDMSHAYTPAYQAIAREEAARLGIRLREGVYMFFRGPQYETPAEVRAAGLLGADAVGMSTVPEVITAVHCGMKVLGFSLLTNMAAGILDQPLGEREVLEAAGRASGALADLVASCAKRV